MKNTFSIIALLYTLLSFAQDYAVSNIPDNLKKNASAVIRKENTVININRIDNMDYQLYSLITVLNKDAKNFATPVISYEKGDNVSDVKVTIYDANGNKVKSYYKSDFKDMASNSQGSFYSDNRILVLDYTPTVFPYTIEFNYNFGTENTIFIPDFIPFTKNNIALQESNFTLNNKSGINLKSKIYPSNFNIGAVTVLKDNNQEKSYQFKDIEAIDDMDLAPKPEKILPKVSFALEQFNLEGKQGSMKDWKDFGEWFYKDLIYPVSISSPEIKYEVKALNLEGKSDDEKVKKIYQYMQSKTHYVFVALGIGGWKPMLPEEVQKKGYGDCKGLTNYMRILLDEAGIKSYYSVINSNPSEISFDPDFPKMDGNHVILMVPTEKGNIWLENTSQQIAYNHLGYTTTGRNVMSVSRDGIKLIDTPDYTAEQSAEKQTLNAVLSLDKTLKGTASFEFTGNQYDFSMPLLNLDAHERIEAIKEQINVINFQNLSLDHLQNDKDQAKISFDLNFTAENFSKNLGNSLIFRSVPIYTNIIFHEDENRTLPFEIRYAYNDVYNINYTLPEGYSVEEFPENTEIKSKYGQYTISYQKKGQQLIVFRNLIINKGIYPKEEYNSYVAFRKKIMGADNAKILISTK